MAITRIDRRTFLRGTGGLTLSLPLLELMAPSRAHGATGLPKRIVFVLAPNGVVKDTWKCQGSETSFTFGSSTAALEPWKSRIIALEGVDCYRSGGDGHTDGMGAALTGMPINSSGDGISGLSTGISVDQVIAKKTGLPSLELAARTMGAPSAWGSMSFLGNKQPVQREGRSSEAWKRLFAGGGSPGVDLSASIERIRVQRQSVLDSIEQDHAALAKLLGLEDRQKVAEHLEALREIERKVDPGATAKSACTTPPAAVGVDGDRLKNGLAMMDIIVTAFKCDLVRVATFMWDGAAGGGSFPGTDINIGHHSAAHEKNITALQKIDTWYAQQFATLLSKMAAVKEGATDLLDSSVVMNLSEQADGYTHFGNNMPYLLAGSCGGQFRTGRLLRFPKGTHHNDLLVSLLNAMGGEATTFGKPDWCRGPLPGLT